MRIIIVVEPGASDSATLSALRTMLRQVEEDNAADPDLKMTLELADPTGRALAVDVVGVVPDEVKSGETYRMAAWIPLEEA